MAYLPPDFMAKSYWSLHFKLWHSRMMVSEKAWSQLGPKCDYKKRWYNAPPKVSCPHVLSTGRVYHFLAYLKV